MNMMNMMNQIQSFQTHTELAAKNLSLVLESLNLLMQSNQIEMNVLKDEMDYDFRLTLYGVTSRSIFSHDQSCRLTLAQLGNYLLQDLLTMLNAQQDQIIFNLVELPQ